MRVREKPLTVWTLNAVFYYSSLKTKVKKALLKILKTILILILIQYIFYSSSMNRYSDLKFNNFL